MPAGSYIVTGDFTARLGGLIPGVKQESFLMANEYFK